MELATFATVVLSLAAGQTGPAAPGPTSLAPAAPPASVAHGGFRLGVYFPLLLVGNGDLKGTDVLIGPEWGLALPKLDDSSEGFGVEVGAGSDAGAMVVRYQRTRHPTPMLGPGRHATLSLISFDARSCMTAALRVQACLDLGLTPYSHLDMEGGAVDAAGRIGTAKLRDAIGFALGASVQAFLGSHISLSAGADWQGLWYSKGGAFDDEPLETEDHVALHALALRIGLAVDL